jgi:hypothetical protein
MKIKIIVACSFLLFSMHSLFAQEDLLGELDVKPAKKEAVTATFKALQICNLQSTKLAAKGEFYMLISHRFGDLTEGLQNFFGLDNANTKIGGIYGVTDWLSIGVSRHTFQKNYETAIKYKLANQLEGGFPVTIVGYNTLDVNTELSKDNYPSLQFSNRLAYSAQLLISRKISESLSLELAPIFTHKNLYDDLTENSNLMLLGCGARYKLTKRLSLNLEYDARMNAMSNNPYHNPMTAGLDIETGGHVFQLVFSNSQAMNDVSVFSNSTGSGSKGIFFGFNMYRVF